MKSNYMNGKDIALTFLIIIIFVTIIIWNIVSSKISDIKTNWPQYRCNPSIMPWAEYFGHDPTQNFNECIKNVQKSNMGDYLQPANYALSLAGKTNAQITGSVHGIRKFLYYLRTQLHSTIRKIFTVFLGIVQPINEILAKFRDLTMRLLGAMTVMLYMVDGSNKTVASTWNSDVGGLVRTLCFEPTTQVNMQDGSFKEMQKIQLGDKLEGGREVLGLLQLKGGDESYYKIYSKKQKKYIYITGSHFIQDPHTQRFIPVADFKDSIKTTKTSPTMSCLITSDNRIPIGEFLFYDWED